MPDSPRSSAGAAEHRPRSAPSAVKINLAVAILCVIWGSTWVVIKGGLEDLPPLTSAGTRFALAAGLMILLAPAVRRREGGGSPPAWLWLSMGALNFTVSYAVVYQTETLLPSGLVCVLWGVFPLMMAVAGHLWLPGERLGGSQWAGFVLGFFGIAVLFHEDLAAFGSEGVCAALLLFVSPLVSVVGTVLVKRYGTRSSSALLNRNAMVFAAVLLSLGAGLFESDLKAVWTLPAIGSVAYLAVIGTVATFGLYFWAMRWAPANRLSLIAYVTPCVALVLGWAFAGEPIYWSTIAGTVLVFSGIGFVARRPSG